MREEKFVGKIAIVWGKWGPYHFARYSGLVKMYGKENCLGIALAGKSSTYQWKPVGDDFINGRIVTMNPHKEQETLSPWKTGIQLFRLLKKESIRFVFLPSYWPARSFAILIAARLAGVKCIMMNESHAATEQAKGISRWIKKQIIKLFHAGLVGGTPHIEYFTSLGMKRERLFKGYDVVDNDYFAEQSAQARNSSAEFRTKLGLPENYILNLGRMVEKKNLSLLVSAYADYVRKGRPGVSLVLIGSGEQEHGLRQLARREGLSVSDLTGGGIPAGHSTVFFGGFRNIEENPLFFALAKLFVLPSTREEWGLVVNEAMACSLPVLVAAKAGCATDLVMDNINGFRIDPSDRDELVERISVILDDATVQGRMGIESKKIIDNWDCDFFAENALRAVRAIVS